MNDTEQGGTGGSFYSVKETAQILGITERTVRKYIQQDRLKAEFVPGKKGRYYKVYKDSAEQLRRIGEQVGTGGSEQGGSGVPPSSGMVSYKDLYEDLKADRERMIDRVIQLEGFKEVLQERLRQSQFMIEERASSLIEKEAKQKELESRLQEGERQRGELAAREEEYQSRLEAEEAKRLDLETHTRDDIRKKEDELHRAEETARVIQAEAERLRQTLQQEQEARAKLEAELQDARLPWWKKIFGTK